jgi:hypothetical protein
MHQVSRLCAKVPWRFARINAEKKKKLDDAQGDIPRIGHDWSRQLAETERKWTFFIRTFFFTIRGRVLRPVVTRCCD